MLPNDLEIAIAGNTHYYSLQSLSEGRSIRRDSSITNLALPADCTIAHSTSGKGDKAIDSYLVRLDTTYATEVDASQNVQSAQTLSVYVVIKVPRGIASGVSLATTMSGALMNLMNARVGGSTVAFVQRVLKGEL